MTRFLQLGVYNKTLNACFLGITVSFVSLESQCFPRPELGTHIFVYLLNRDQTHVAEWVLTSHCTKSLMQCLFFDISCSPPPIRSINYRFWNICVYITRGLEIMLFKNRAYTKHQDIHDGESFRKSWFLYSALKRPIQYCMVTASDIEISSLLNRNPLKDSRKLKIFLAICLNLLIYYGHWYL